MPLPASALPFASNPWCCKRHFVGEERKWMDAQLDLIEVNYKYEIIEVSCELCRSCRRLFGCCCELCQSCRRLFQCCSRLCQYCRWLVGCGCELCQCCRRLFQYYCELCQCCPIGCLSAAVGCVSAVHGRLFECCCGLCQYCRRLFQCYCSADQPVCPRWANRGRLLDTTISACDTRAPATCGTGSTQWCAV